LVPKSATLVDPIDEKNIFYVFYKSLKTCFCNVFFYFLNVFCAFNVMFLLLLKTKKNQKTYKIKNMMHFSWAKTPFPRQSECFVAVLLTLFDFKFQISNSNLLKAEGPDGH